MKKHILLLTSVFLLSLQGMTQLKAGNKNFNRLAYTKAASNYEKALAKDSSDAQTWSNLGDCYRLTRNSAGAEHAYGHLVKSGKASPVHHLYYAEALMQNEKYQEAKKALDKYKISAPSDDRSNNLEEGINKLSEILALSGAYNVKALNINSKESDICPVPFKGGIVFSSNRKYVEWVDNSHSWTGKQFYRLYHATGNESSFGKPTLFAGTLQSKYHDGPVSFNTAGNQMIFTRNNYINGTLGKDEKEIVRLKLFSSVLSDDNWGIEVELPFNSDNYSCAHPALSADGKTLYFSSDMPGGKGGMDIWTSNWNGSNWTTPTLIGGKINTAGNEVFPFIAEDGVLYFSSDGQPGIGGLDIYSTISQGNDWSTPENLGAPVNSPDDDFGVTYKPSTKTGYFSSNRKAQGLNDDLYSFQKLCTNTNIAIIDEEDGSPLAGAVVSIFENGKEIGKVTTDQTGKFFRCLNPLRNYEFKAAKDNYTENTSELNSSQISSAASTGTEAVVALKKKPINIANVSGRIFNQDDKSPVPSQTVTLVNKKSGETQTTITDDKGNYRFEKLELDCDYEVKTVKKDCGEPVEKFNTKNIIGTKNITMDIPLLCKGDVIKIDNIYYDYNKSDIRPDAALELDKLVNILNKYPTMTIELRSHTDSRGKDAYNEKLSDSRAKSAAEYIFSKGIQKTRLKAKGYGEKELLNKCINGVECDDKMHEENRRTEFKILSL